jgi:hypothetical protein
VTEPKSEPIKASVIVQISPLPDRGVQDLAGYAEQLTGYLSHNFERFADPRGADLLITLVVQRGEENAGHSYRSGHYLEMETVTVTTEPLVSVEQCLADPGSVLPRGKNGGPEGLIDWQVRALRKAGHLRTQGSDFPSSRSGEQQNPARADSTGVEGA